MAEAMGRREQKKLMARSRILEAAVAQFASCGFQAASVADIMKAADMGLGTFYNYFASKEELLHCLLDGLAVQLQQHLQELQEQRKGHAEILRERVMLTARLVGQNRYVLPLFLSAGKRQGAGSWPQVRQDRHHRRMRPRRARWLPVMPTGLPLWGCFCSWCSLASRGASSGMMCRQRLSRRCSIPFFRRRLLAACPSALRKISI